MARANLVGGFNNRLKGCFLHRGSAFVKLCGARLETRRDAASRGWPSCFLVDMLEESCDEPSRFRGCAGTMACGFGLLRGMKTALRARGAASARWRGAPADAPPRALGRVTRAVRLRFFAGCRLARGRSAMRRLPRVLGARFARRGPVLATARGRSPDGVLYAGSFQTLTPPLPRLNFL